MPKDFKGYDSLRQLPLKVIENMILFARFCQLTGIIMLPLAMFLELSGSLGRGTGISDMVLMLIFGTAIFYLGRLIEGYSRPK